MQLSDDNDDVHYYNKDITTITKVLTNPIDIDNTLNQLFSNIKHNYDTCIDATGPYVITSIEPMRKSLGDAGARGIRIRIITEITKDNLSYCNS